MKHYSIFLLLILFLCVCFSCKKDEKLSQPAPLTYYVSGDYLCNDSSYHSFSTYDSLNIAHFAYTSYDSNYIIPIIYIDTNTNTISFRNKNYILNSNGIYSNLYQIGPGRNTYSFDSLSISNNKIYYMHWANPGGDNYYTVIKGEKIK